SKPRRSAKSRNWRFQTGSPVASRRCTTSLVLSYRHVLGRPPNLANALRWQRMNVSVVGRETNSTYMARDQRSTITKAHTRGSPGWVGANRRVLGGPPNLANALRGQRRNVSVVGRETNSTYMARAQLSTITKAHTRRSLPSAVRYAKEPQSTWACSPGAVSNRIVAWLAATRRRNGRTKSLRMVYPPVYPCCRISRRRTTQLSTPSPKRCMIYSL